MLIYNLKLKLFILITLVDFAELLTDFSYTNFSVGLSNVDALDMTSSIHGRTGVSRESVMVPLDMASILTTEAVWPQCKYFGVQSVPPFVEDGGLYQVQIGTMG